MASAYEKSKFEAKVKELQSSKSTKSKTGTSNKQGGSGAKKFVPNKPQTEYEEKIQSLWKNSGRSYSFYDDDLVNQFISDADSYLKKSQSNYDSMAFSNASSLYEDMDKEYQNLRSRYDAVMDYMNYHELKYDPEVYTSVMSYLEDLSGAMLSAHNTYYNANKYYSQWESEDEYNWWQEHGTVEKRQDWYDEQQNNLKMLKAERYAENSRWNEALAGYDPESYEFMAASQKFYGRQKELDDEIAAVEAEIQNYKRGNFNEDGFYYGNKTVDDYFDFTERPDFLVDSAKRDYDNPTREELSKYDAMNDSSTWRVDADGVYRDAYGNALKADESGKWVNPNTQGQGVADRLGLFLSTSAGDRQEAAGAPIGTEGTWETVIKDGIDGSWDQLTENEIAIYYYLLNNDGQQTADKYLSDMKTELNRRNTTAGNKRMIEAFDEANALEKIALSVATVPAQMFSGVAGTIENAANTLMGNEVNPYSAAHSGMNFSSTARGLQAAEFDNTGLKIPGINFTLGDAYQAGMSILDSYASIGIGGRLGGALLASSAATSEAKRLYEQGASMEQIAVASAAAGAAEMVFESLSIDKLINMKDAKTVGQVIKNVLIQGGIEASEEGFTEIANILTNAVIMGQQSDWAKLVEENDGDKWKAFLSEVQSVAHASFSGFLSGMGSASVPSAVSYANTQSQYANTGKDIIEAEGGVDALKALAMDVSGVDSKLAKQAGKVSSDNYVWSGLNKAEAAAKTRKSQKAVGKLYESVRAEVAAQNQADIAKSLEESGFSPKSAKNIASAIVARANGEDLSGFQKSTLDAVKNNQKVQEIVDKIYKDANSSVSKRNLNLDKYSLGIKMGVGLAPGTAEKAAPKNITVSENGKMMNTETKKAIDHPVLAKAEDGTYKIVDENAGLVSSENVSYESHDQGMVVESFVNLSTDFGKVNKVIASMDLASRNRLLSLYNPAVNPDGGMFVNGVLDAYFYGHRGVDLSVAQKGSPINKLTEQQRQVAWETGRAAGEKATAAEQSNVDTVYAEAQKVLDQTGKKKGTYHATLEAGISHFNLTPEQKVVYNVADEIAQGIQTNIRVYDGTNTAQGFYNHETDEIMLNLNAANKGRDAIMAFTLAHEIVHRAKKGSPAKYQAFTEFLMKEYGKQGSDVEAMIQEQMDAAERYNKKVPKDKQILMTEEKALEEVVSDACQRMLLDTNAGQKLAEFGAQSKENKSFLEDLKRWISELLEKLRSYFAGVDPDSKAAKEFAKFDENVKQTLADMYVEMATEAGEKLSTIKAAYGGLDSVLKKNAEAIAEDAILTEGAVVTDGERSYSIKSMKADIAEGKMFEDLKNVCGWTQRQVNDLKQSLEELVEYMTPFRDILDMNETYGMEGRRFSPYKPNSDPLYKISMDFSTLCSKRLLTQYVIENLQLRENRPMTAEEQMAIRDMLNEYRKVEKGLQVACAMCYVEAARLKSPKQINKWLDDPATQMRNYFADKNTEFANYIKEKQADFKESRGYDRNATKKDMSAKDVRELNKIRPRLRSQYEVNAEEAQIIERAKALPSSTYLTAGNLANLSETDPVIYTAYTAFVRTATRSKSLETDEPYYYGDSTRDNGNGIVVTDSFIESVNRENGMRFSSWSDWRIQHLLDYITAVIDNSVRGAAMHGYTKFGDEVRVLGKTGMMFNMSGVAGTQNGLNEDGSLSFSPTESIDVNEAIQLREEFPETAGLQCIGVSYDHIVALLRSDIIDYVIPYHVSGLNAGLRAMANIHGWDDFTTTQHAAIDKSIKLEDAVDKEHWREEPVFSEFFVGYDTGMTGIEDMRASADRYVQMCKDRGLKPKFEQFLGEENYWKLLIDRKMINQKTGKLIQQRAVTPTFDFNTIKGVVDKYVQNYDSGLESRALNHVVENWDSIPKRIKDLKKQGTKKANKASKAVDTLSNQTLAAQPKGVEQVEKSFSLSKTVEETKDLLAFHNITEELLWDALNREGLLMPSVAITNKGMTDFGDISLLFDKSTIDPAVNSDNKLYGADAWTPTQTKLKKNAKFDTDKTVRAVNNVKNRIGSKYVASLFNVTAKQFKETIIKADGSIYDAYAHNVGMQTAYAMEQGIISKIPTNKDGSINEEALKKQLNKELDTDNGWRQYKKWLNNISDTIITSYDTASNEDILNNMKAQPATAKTFKLSESGELVVPAAEYSSIDEVRKNKNRLSENAAEATKAVADEFLALAKKIGKTNSVVDAINAAFANRYSTADIVKTFNSKGIEISNQTASELQSLYRKAVELPTQYFEAKPGGKIGLNQVHTAVVPETASAELHQALEKLGINVVDYNGTNESRVETMNSMEALMFSLPKVDSSSYQESAYPEWAVEVALYDALEHKDMGDDNLIKVGNMPRYVVDKIGIEGDFYIYRNHAYENMVSAEQAKTDTRFSAKAHYHDLGIEKMTDAIMALETPIMTIATKTKDGNPAVIMILPVEGKNKAPLYAVLSFYSDRKINGDYSRKPHIVLTVSEREYFGNGSNRGYAEIIKQAVEEGRVIDFDKKMRDSLSVIANQARVGDITDASLNANLSHFRKEIKSFREKNNIDYKLPVGEDTSPRALLANAFEGIITNDIEKRRIQEYKAKVEMLNEEEKKLSELRAQIKELSFAKGKRDTKKIRDLQFDANHTANRIATLDKTLLGLEASAPLQNILKREKEMAYKRGLEKNKEKSKTARQQVIETREKRYAREKLQKLVIDTAKWISYPSKTDVKCPDILKQPYADFLNGIDLSSKRMAAGGDPTKNDLRLTSAMDSLATALDRVMASQDPNQDTTAVLDTGYLDLPAGFVQKLRDMTESIKAMMVEGEFVVNTMTAAEVRQLSQMIRTLNHAIKEVSTLYANLRFANVEALGDETMGFIDDLGEIEKSSSMNDFVQWENALPYYAFKRFGDGGQSIFEGLMDGQDKLAFLAQKIFDFGEKTWTSKEAKAWSEDTHTINLPDGENLTLTTADAMSIYCLSRREQGMKHLLGGGTRVMGIQKGSKKAQDSRSLLTIKDIDTIISSLTDRQKQVAEAMQEFMSTTCSEWGNEISMKRFLTKEFNEKFYFPIESNDENLATKDPSAQQSDLFRLLNISATKPIDPRANNEVIIRNIFDVFTGHASDMARLNAFGMPLLDYMKWLNYREKTVNDEGQVKVRGVRKSMEKAYGNAAKSYVLNLIKDVNGRASDGGDPSILMKWMRSAKTASVGSSLRVATLQVTSYPRAALVLSPKNLALGLSKLPKIDMAKKYCGIALWKSFGFYDTNIARSIEDQMKGVKDIKQKLIELSLKGAEWGDAITWGCLWNACEYEVAATGKYTVGTEEFNQAVGKKLREVVYATQVVDSTLTRSQIMRSKRGMAQEAAAFMSEPTLSANILMGAGFEFGMEKRRTGSAKAAWQKTGKLVGRAVAVYSIGQLTAALLEGLWDAWRDDEDEKFGEKYLNAFVENLALDLVPFNKIPIVSDVFEAALAMFGVGFYSSDKMSTTWLTQAVSAAEAWKKVLGGESSMTAYNALYKSVRAISSFYGVSFSGVMREGVALWNNTAGAADSTLKVRQYELTKGELGNELYEAIVTGDTRQAASLKAKFEDDYAISSALRKALRENDPRIREAAIAWNANDLDEYMRIARAIIAEKHFVQDDVVMAIRAEASALAPDGDETSTSKAKGLFTADKFAEAIAQGDQAMANAIKLDIIQTAQNNGKTESDAEKSFANTAKGDLKELFLEGSVTEAAAINALTTFCGDTQSEAEERVSKWAFEVENGFSYENRRELFLNGEITIEQVRKALVTIGGKTDEEASKEVEELLFEAEHGFAYSDRGDAYKEGKISAQELKNILVSIGGKTSEEADFQIQAYDWEVQGYEGVTAAAVRDYNEHCSTANVPKDVYLYIRSFSNDTKNDVDANGKTIYYSAMKKIMAEINAQTGLTAAQKTAIARSLGWAEKNIKKYKLW